MPSKRIYSPGSPALSSAGSAAPETTANIDPWAQLPTREETDRLLAEHLPSPEETERLLREMFAPPTSAIGADVVDDLADLDHDDPRYLVVDLPPLEEHPE